MTHRIVIQPSEGTQKEFLATHEAWRGDPRIHICQERVKKVPDVVIQSVLHHEISHALLTKYNVVVTVH